MVNVLTLLSIVVIGCRIKKRLFTSGEWILLGLFVLHTVLTQLQLYLDTKNLFYYDHRYTDPGFFLLWGWLAWAVVKMRLKYVAFVALACLGCYATYKFVRYALPWTRGHRQVEVCQWAAEVIKSDWSGPSRDEGYKCYMSEYHLLNRPVICSESRYVAYLVGGRGTHRVFWQKANPIPEVPDYWLSDSESSAPPKNIAYRKLAEHNFNGKKTVIFKRSDGQ